MQTDKVSLVSFESNGFRYETCFVYFVSFARCRAMFSVFYSTIAYYTSTLHCIGKIDGTYLLSEVNAKKAGFRDITYRSKIFPLLVAPNSSD